MSNGVVIPKDFLGRLLGTIETYCPGAAILKEANLYLNSAPAANTLQPYRAIARDNYFSPPEVILTKSETGHLFLRSDVEEYISKNCTIEW